MWMNSMKALENSGLEKEDLKLKYTKKESHRLLLIIRNMKDKSELH